MPPTSSLLLLLLLLASLCAWIWAHSAARCLRFVGLSSCLIIVSLPGRRRRSRCLLLLHATCLRHSLPAPPQHRLRCCRRRRRQHVQHFHHHYFMLQATSPCHSHCCCHCCCCFFFDSLLLLLSYLCIIEFCLKSDRRQAALALALPCLALHCLHSSNCCRCRTIMIEPRDASLLFTFRGLGMFMPSKYLHKLLQRQRQQQPRQQQQELPATIAAADVAFAIEPSLPALPIVTSGQITASAKAMSAARDCRSERSSSDPPSDPQTDPQLIHQLILDTIIASFTVFALFFGSLQRRTLIFIDSSQRFINDRAGCARDRYRYSRQRERGGEKEVEVL